MAFWAVVCRTARYSKTILDRQAITFGGQSDVSLANSGAGLSITTPLILTSDTIAMPLDKDHDYYIYVWFPDDAAHYNRGVSYFMCQASGVLCKANTSVELAPGDTQVPDIGNFSPGMSMGLSAIVAA